MDALNRAKRSFWIALALTLVLGAAIASTAVFVVFRALSPRVSVELHMCALVIDDWPVDHPPFKLEDERVALARDKFHVGRASIVPQYTTLDDQWGKRLNTRASIPLWPILLPSAIIAYRAHRTGRRLSRAGCKRCGYSRAGLAAYAPCPECGRV